MSFSRPMSRASSLQSLTSASSYSPSFSSREPVLGASLNRIKSASVTGLSTPSSFTPMFSYRQQASFSSTNRFSSSSTPAPFRSSLVDIRRPPTTIDRYPSDRYQSYGSRYSSVPSVIPAVSVRPIRAPSPTPTPRFYAGANPYLSSYANTQGVGAYSKLLKYSFASGANRDRSEQFTPPAIITRGVNKDRVDRSSEYQPPSFVSRQDYSSGPAIPRSSYFETGRSYRSSGGGGGESYYGGRTSLYGGGGGGGSGYRSATSRYGDSDDTSDLYKTRFRPTGAMSKYWTQPRKLFTA